MDLLPILPLALLLDVLIGDPDSELHPIRQLGHVLDGGRRRLVSLNLTGPLGALLLVVVPVVALTGGYLLLWAWVLPLLPSYVSFFINAGLVSLCITFRSLFDHALNVVTALRENDLDRAREAVRPLTRRETEQLDAHSVARAAVEALSAGYLDRFLAPLFWFGAGALAGIWFPAPIAVCGIAAVLLHRTISTLKRIVQPDRSGRSPGWIGIFLHTLMNYLPARLSIPFLFLASLSTGADTNLAGRTWFREAHRHPSPNAGPLLSFLAGALHLRLGGPEVHPDRVIERPWIGEGTPEATELHVKQGIQLIFIAAATAFFSAFVFLVGVEQVHRSMLSPY